jgi:hypothetical protein
MAEEVNFETFLYISKNDYKIFVLDKKKQENIYKAETNIKDILNFQDLSNLSKFLDSHIYKIEKIVDNFIKNIILIVENEENLNVNIGIKKKNYENSVNQKYLESNLKELKDLFRENYQERTIMHMIVVSYIIDGERHASFKSDLITNHLNLEVNFISISNELTFKLEKVLEKYQIKISQFMCGNYIKNFFNNDNSDISLMTYKLINVYNTNEVALIPKNLENKGFFEKFFQLFS